MATEQKPKRIRRGQVRVSHVILAKTCIDAEIKALKQPNPCKKQIIENLQGVSTFIGEELGRAGYLWF